MPIIGNCSRIHVVVLPGNVCFTLPLKRGRNAPSFGAEPSGLEANSSIFSLYPLHAAFDILWTIAKLRRLPSSWRRFSSVGNFGRT